MAVQGRGTPGDDDTVFRQQGPDLVDQPRLVLGDLATQVTQQLLILLFERFDPDRTYFPMLTGLGNSTGIIGVVFLPPLVALDVLRGQQADAMPQFHDLPPPIMSPGTSFHGNVTGWLFGQKSQQLPTPQIPVPQLLATGLEGHQRKQILC